jgi:hypothetical protein
MRCSDDAVSEQLTGVNGVAQVVGANEGQSVGGVRAGEPYPAGAP